MTTPAPAAPPAGSATASPSTRTFKVWRGDATGGAFATYTAAISPGMVVLDAIHQIQATQAGDLACRWNCKAGKCGSCSAEINGKPRLMCLTRMETLPAGDITVQPMRSFPIMRDLVTDVSWNYTVNRRIAPFTPKAGADESYWRMQQHDVDRSQEFRKCIECFLCQNTCHVIRDHDKKDVFAGPRFFIRAASLEMHPLDTADRTPFLKHEGGLGFCNITKCCTEVCPEHIRITDNGIIPLKERLVDRYYDPVAKLFRWLFKRPSPSAAGTATAPQTVQAQQLAATEPAAQRPAGA
jgi:succinate dehydrogenase / fumarate reductase iron-sulfur subunit